MVFIKIWGKSFPLPWFKHVRIGFLAATKAAISELLSVGDFDSTISVGRMSPPLPPPRNPTGVKRKRVITGGRQPHRAFPDL